MEDIVTFSSVLIASGGLLLAVSCLLSKLSTKVGVPLSILFLGLGMLAGEEGIGGIRVEQFEIAYGFGTLALIVILWVGGLNTPVSLVRRGIAPAGILATLGVIGVTFATALGARQLGLGWGEALLIGAIVSSTDAAAVFSALRGVHLRGRISPIIEVESGINDPVAVILTAAMTAHMIGSEPLSWALIPRMLQELAIGAGAGVAFGFIGQQCLRRIPLVTPALYPVLSIALALLTYGKASLLGGSGILAVYVAALLAGRSPLPHHHMLNRVHESMSWLSQVAMFLMLGMLVKPSELPGVAGTGLLLALFIAFIARPLIVTLCLAPFRLPWRETLCVGWCGLRGAMPIILATIPILAAQNQIAEMRSALNVFEHVFFIVVVGALLPGSTVKWLTARLGLQDTGHPQPRVNLIIDAQHHVGVETLNFYLHGDSAVAGRTLQDIALPSPASVAGVVRRQHLLPARGDTRLAVGDHVVVLCKREAESAVCNIFGADSDPPSQSQTFQSESPTASDGPGTHVTRTRRTSWHKDTAHS